MTIQRPFVFGNWKMNGLLADVDALAGELARRRRSSVLAGMLGVFPPATLLHAATRACDGSGVVVGGQDCHADEKGAFTGSVSAAMLRDAGAGAVIVGHSERRQRLSETDADACAKAEAGLRAGLLVILCIGETEAEWSAGSTLDVLDRQLEGSLPRAATPDTLVVAYEPVWAIGTGRSAGHSDIARTHAAVRLRLASLVPEGQRIPILYGGSVKADNAGAIMAVDNVDGVLVGGASLDASGFWAIFEAGARA